MSNLLVIVTCLLIGLLLQKSRRLPENASSVLNLYVIYVALPALVLAELPKLQLDNQVLVPVISAWSAMLLSVLLVFLLSKCFSWSRQITAVMYLLVPLGNTSFVGFPMVEALLGSHALPYAIVYDQLGSFLAVSSYGMFVLAYYSGDTLTVKSLLRKLASFPPFISVFIAFILLGVDYPVWLYHGLSRIGDSLVPVVMVAVGLSWQLRLDRAHLPPLALALLLKLMLIPAVVWLGLTFVGDINPLVMQASILEAAMPSMITAGALAMSHNIAPRLVSSIVGYSLLFSLISLPAWCFLIQSYA